jgi:hypothetical protein
MEGEEKKGEGKGLRIPFPLFGSTLLGKREDFLDTFCFFFFLGGGLIPLKTPFFNSLNRGQRGYRYNLFFYTYLFTPNNLYKFQ